MKYPSDSGYACTEIFLEYNPHEQHKTWFLVGLWICSYSALISAVSQLPLGLLRQMLHLWSIITLALLVLSGYYGLVAGVWQVLGGPRSSTGLCCRLASLRLGSPWGTEHCGGQCWSASCAGPWPRGPCHCPLLCDHLDRCTWEALCIGPSYSGIGFSCTFTMGLAAPAHPLEAATGSEWCILQLASTRHAGVLWWHSHGARLIKMCLLVMVTVPGLFFWGSKQEGRQTLLTAGIPSASDTFVFMLEFQSIWYLPVSSPSVFILCQAGGVLSLGRVAVVQLLSHVPLCDPMGSSMPG